MKRKGDSSSADGGDSFLYWLDLNAAQAILLLAAILVDIKIKIKDGFMMLLLASSSPRRRELLEQAGFVFQIVPANADEHFADGTPPDKAVTLLARRKAEVVRAAHPDGVILAADTMVYVGGRILGKPKTPEIAREMLRLLSGQIHTVYTGWCVLSSGEPVCGCEVTSVEFWPLTDAEIDAYVATGEPMGKAGAYGIQGRGCTLVKRIEGDFYNVMGLPISRVARVLRGCRHRNPSSCLE